MRNVQVCGVFVAALIAGAGTGVCAGQCQKGWKPTEGGPGFPPPFVAAIRAMAEWDDGRGPALYVAGDSLVRAGDTPVQGIARWDGSGWEPLGGGLSGAQSGSDTVQGLVVHGNRLVAGGQLSIAGGQPARRVAAWNGFTWTPMSIPTNEPSSFPGYVRDLQVHNGQLVAVGEFLDLAPPSSQTHALLVWNGGSWVRAGYAIGGFASARAGTVHDGELILGGAFYFPPPVNGRFVVRVVGAELDPVGIGPNADVYAVESFNGELVAGGRFNACGAVSTWGVARAKGNAWDRFGDPLSRDAIPGRVSALGLFTDRLVVLGDFDNAGNFPVGGLAQWTQGEWNSIGGGNVYLGGDPPNGTFCVVRDELIVAASNVIEPLGQWSIGRWTGSTWKPLGLGFDNAIRCFAIVNGQLHAGGFFRYTGGEPSGRVAAFDGAKWNPRDSGMNDWVLALGSFNGQPVAGGSFTQASGQTAGRIARWDGATWQPLAGGVNGKVYAVAEHGGLLFAGGAFTQADSIARPHVAAWNGAQWSDVGGGVDGNVRALHAFGGQLIAGGEFNTAGGGAASRIALWTGSQWQPLGAGMNDDVHALTTYNGLLIAAGEFTQAGGAPASRIAAWDGVAWQPLGAGLNGPVWALTEYEGDLLVGGHFTTAGGGPAMNIARWDGAAWHVLGNGVGTVADEVRALAVIDGDLHVGGSFNVVNAGAADQRICAFWARWGTIGPPGDADHDHDVDQDDMDLILFNFGRSARPGFNGDVTEDMVVDQDDLDAVLFNFGGVCP